MPKIDWAAVFTASKSLTTLTPPALPLPPACIWALTTYTGPGRSLAAFVASSTEKTAFPSGVGILYNLNNSLA